MNRLSGPEMIEQTRKVVKVGQSIQRGRFNPVFGGVSQNVRPETNKRPMALADLEHERMIRRKSPATHFNERVL